MGTVELLDIAIDWARRAGFEVREEWLGGVAGGACTIRGRRVLFLGIALPPAERLGQVLAALQALGTESRTRMPPELRHAVESYAQQATAAENRFQAA